MNSDNSLQFELYYEGRMVTCRVETGESDYGIHFGGELVGVIEMDENGLWEAQGDALDPTVANEIGKRIEDHGWL
jgi:hypothetical protein